MDSSVKARNVEEPKLNDLTSTSGNAIPFKEKIKGHDLTNYGWNLPGASNTLTSTLRVSHANQSKNPAIHVGFKEPLVSYHQKNDPLSNSARNDEDVLLTPKYHPAITRFLNTSDLTEATKPHCLSPARNLNATGISKIVTHHDKLHDPSEPALYSQATIESGKMPDMRRSSKHFANQTKLPDRPKQRLSSAEKLKQCRVTDDNSEALARLKATIKKQKENRSPSSQSLKSPDRKRDYYSHEETSISTMYQVKMDKVPIRKIAVGPAAPKYKGFNTAETRLRTPDGKIWREDDFRANNDTFAISTKPKALFQEATANRSMHKTYSAGPTSKPASHKSSKASKSQVKKKTVRKIGKIETGNHVHKKSVITPSSWREGQRVAQAVLNATTKQPTKHSEKSASSKESTSRPAQDESLSTDTVVNDMLIIESKKQVSANDISSNIGKDKLSKEAKGVLKDLNQSSSSDDDQEPMNEESVPPEPKFASPKRKRSLKRKPQPSKQEKADIPKIRHYDPVQVQQYIAKQKADRKRKQAELKRQEKAANDKKNKLLHDLDKRQKEARKKAISAEGQQKEKKSNLEDTYSKSLQSAADESPKGYRERIASFMEKLEQINSMGLEKQDSPERAQAQKSDKPISKFLLKLGECMQDTETPNQVQSDRPHSSREALKAFDHSERQRTYSDSLPADEYYYKQPGAESQPSKLDRIAALRAKSESLQERLEQESKKIMEQPGFNLSLSGFTERFSPRRTERSPAGSKRLPSPRYHLTPSSSSPIPYKSDESSDISYPGMTNLPPDHPEMSKGSSSSTSRTSNRDCPPGSEAWDVTGENRYHSLPKTTETTLADGRPNEEFSMADMMYRLNKEEYCAKDKPSWRDKTYENEREDPAIRKHFEQHLSPRAEPRSFDQASALHNSSLRSSQTEQELPPWKRGNGDKYSVMNLFTRKYLKSMKPQHNAGAGLPDEPYSKVTTSPRTAPAEERSSLDADQAIIRDSSPRLPKSSALHRDVSAGARVSAPSQQIAVQTSPRDPATDLIKWSETLGRRKDRGEQEQQVEAVDADDSDISEPVFRPLPSTQPANVAMRFSPAVLEQKLALELNRCETIEEQIKQLAHSERTQGVAMAQQESVSIAQILQSRQMQHELEMERLAMQAKEKAMEASQKLQAVQMENTAEKTAQKEKLNEEKAKMTSQMQMETRKNLKLQNEVAHASIKALQRLGGQKTYSDSSQFSKTSSYASSRADTISQDRNYDSTSFDSYSDSTSKPHQPRPDDHSPASILSEHSTTSVHPHDSGSIPEEIEQDGGGKHDSSNSSSIKEVFDGQESADRSISEDIPFSPKPSKTKEKEAKDTSSKKIRRKEELSDTTSIHFDDTFTEDEIMEISKRAIMPSESYRRHQAKKSSLMKVPSFMLDQSEVSVSSDDALPAKNQSYFSGLDDSVLSSASLFGNTESNSFNRFMSDRVRQYMREEEVRARHQAAMLQLREKALKEKTEVDLAWLDLKKKQIRNKGDDDKMPPLKKKKRAILLRWQVESEEIKKLKAANKAATHDRELMKQQQKDINRMMLSTQQVKEKLKAQGEYDGKAKIALASEIKSSTPVPQLLGSGPSESEDFSESDANLNTSTTSQLLQRLKKSLVGLDGRRLTKREKVLLKRRKEAERLLEWKRKLDEEEKKVYDMEKQALNAWGEKEPAKSPNTTLEKDMLKEDEKPTTSNAMSSVAEEISTSRSDSTITSMHNELKSSLSRPQEVSSEEALEEDYTQSFESVEVSLSKSERQKREASASGSPKTSVDDKTSALTTKADATTPLLGRKSPAGVRGPKNRESVESWSDESFSQTQSETEQSDVECRVHALKEELKRRRLIADRLKKQQKKKHKEHLRAQEASLKSQIEAYDAFIKTTQQELNLELDSPSSGTPSILAHAAAAKPQIRSPRKSDQSRHHTRSLRHTVPSISSPDASPRAGSQKHSVGSFITRQQSDSESSGRSSRSLSFDEEQHSPEDATTPNGSLKSLLHNVSSRSNNEKSITSPEIPAALQDRPKKLDFATNKGLRSMIPLPSNKSSSSTGKLLQEDVPSSKPIDVQQKADKQKSTTPTSPSSSSDDISIATEEEVSEHLSETSTDKSGASLPLFEVTNQEVDDLIDEDKTPVASPLTTPTPSLPHTPTPDHPDNQLIQGDVKGVDVSDGAILARRETPEVLPDFSKQKTQEVADKRLISNQQTASEISDNLFNHLLKESVDSALSVHKSTAKRSRLPVPESKRPKRNDLSESDLLEMSTPEKRPHSESSPKLTPSAKNLLQLLALDDEEGEKKADRVSDDMATSLMDETIHKVLAIRKAKENKLRSNEGSPQKSPQEQENGKEIEDIVRNAEESEVEPTFLRPVSPVFGTSQDTDEWFDDDFGLSKSKQKNEFLAEDNWAIDTPIPSEIITPRLETPVIEFAIPHTREDVLAVADPAIDYLHGKFAGNELFVDGTTSFEDYDPIDENDQFEARDKANRVFRNSIFDLVRALMREVYSSGDEKSVVAPWHKTRRKRRPTFCRSPPKSKTEVVGTIRDEVARLLGYPESKSKIDPKISLKWGTMKKKDNVDLLLIEELREEEAEWTDYDIDESAVKMQLTDTVFDLLLHDTINCLNKIDKSKKNFNTSA